MATRRQRERAEKERRHASPPRAVFSARDLQRTDRVERLAYTRGQAAEVLGVSLATIDRRVIPVVETVRTEWGTRLIPLDELERYLADRWQRRPGACRPRARPGRKSDLEPELVARIHSEYASGRTLGEIARQLDADGVRTSQGGGQWWTVGGSCRSRPVTSAELR